ncbi:HlyD family type I secretion periplasmic adaptor subunit [Massilia antarctica]|uniref:Membrane fusion protein (MFP) family protein n=2 Tax=Massilia antarctica TaxID=2765360 RepID=A0AA48WF16_9BURK|nr:HlyD family type I secretion periplasmic adaptor subunit [Massilia antarctica]QPI50080.1 HlyD family type I secretion periplasmic adaptor subunit [Massilia antarctica]
MTTMSPNQTSAAAAPPLAGPSGATVIPLRPPKRWHDPLSRIERQGPSTAGRIVLRAVSVLVLVMIVWAAFGKLDVIASADGKLAPQTLVKIVQPSEAGVVKELLVHEGDTVKAGQVLARLDATIASADKTGVSSDLGIQRMQVRRIEAELSGKPMLARAADDALLFAQVERQYQARRGAFNDSLEQEKALLQKMEFEKKSAGETLAKLEQTLPTYQAAAKSLAELSQEGYVPLRQSADKEREAVEKARDLDAQRSTVAALNSAMAAQRQKLSQLHSTYKSDLERELAEIRAKLGQLQPSLDKSSYREGQMVLRAPQDGVIKDLATTTTGAVVQPGAVVLTLVPKDELLFADVNIKNEDVGFVAVGQRAKVKLAAYPFQRHGMLSGTVIHISADASEPPRPEAGREGSNGQASGSASYKARIRLDQQALKDPQGKRLHITPGMQVVVEINQGQRTVLEYLLSPVQKAVSEAARER